jgi:hypothetical protein
MPIEFNHCIHGKKLLHNTCYLAGREHSRLKFNRSLLVLIYAEIYRPVPISDLMTVVFAVDVNKHLPCSNHDCLRLGALKTAGVSGFDVV